MFQKIASLKISVNSLLTKVTTLQFLKMKSQPHFLKVFQKIRQISKNSSAMEFLFNMLQAYKRQPSDLRGFKIPGKFLRQHPPLYRDR